MKQQSRCRCRSSFGATIFLVSVAVCLPVLLLNVMAMDGNETNGVDTTSRFDPDTLERLETMWHSQGDKVVPRQGSLHEKLKAQLAKDGETKTELELPNQDDEPNAASTELGHATDYSRSGDNSLSRSMDEVDLREWVVVHEALDGQLGNTAESTDE